MGTHASIAIEREDGTILASYVHYDGYIRHTGRMLTQYYASEQLAEKLVSLGNLSFLDRSCEGQEGHSFESPVPGETIVYGRDRGETGQEPKFYDSFDEYLAMVGQEFGSSYNYLFMDGQWIVFNRHGEAAQNVEAAVESAQTKTNEKENV